MFNFKIDFKFEINSFDDVQGSLGAMKLNIYECV